MPASSTLTWYDGGKKPPRELFPEGSLEEDVPAHGTLIVGDKGSLFSPTHYGERFRLLPDRDFEGFVGPDPWLPRSPGIHAEWLAACKGGARPYSNFDHAGRFTEAVLLGNVAIRSGERIEWDAGRMCVTNSERANRFVRDDYAYGYSIDV